MMLDPILICFAEIEKRAVSAASTLRLLQARAGQGARIAPGLMAGAQHAAATGAQTSPMLRRLALDSGQAARAQQQARSMLPVKAGLQQRIQQADAMGAASFSQTPLRHHDAFNNTHTYSPAHINTIAGSASRVADPKGLMAAATGPASAATVPAAATQAGATVVSKPRPRPVPAAAVDVNAQTMIRPRAA